MSKIMKLCLIRLIILAGVNLFEKLIKNKMFYIVLASLIALTIILFVVRYVRRRYFEASI